MSFLSGGALVTKTPLGLTSSWFPSMPGMSGPTWPSAYGALYRQQLWVYTVVNKLAAGVARLPLPVYQRDDLNRPRADGHPMARLLSNPNPGLSSFALWEWTSSTFDVFGEAFWYKRRQGGQVVGLYPLHPANMTFDEAASAWDYRSSNLEMLGVPSSDLVHFMHYNPDSTRRGLSPLEPLRQTLENEWHARNATSSFWQNGARPGVALSHPGQLSAPAAERLKAQWQDVAGGSGKTGSTVVLEEGMKPEVLTLSAEEAQYIETRKLNREEVCGAYDVPPPAVHILDHATFSNITEQMRSVYRDTQAPRLRRFEATIETDLRRAEWPNDDVYAEFLMDEVLRGDFEARQDALSKASHMTIAEKRKIENLPFIDGTDRIFLNAAEQPMAAPQTGDAPAAPPFQQVGLPALIAAGVLTDQDARELLGLSGVAPGPPEAPVPALPTSSARSVMGRLSWQKSLDEVDPGSVSAGMDDSVSEAVTSALVAERRSGGSVSGLRDRIRCLVVKDANDDAVARVLTSYFKRQAAALEANGGKADSAAWNAALSDDLHGVAVRISGLIGREAAEALGFSGSYDVDRTVEFLRAISERVAGNINATTAREIDAGAEVAETLTKAQESRAPGIAVAVTTLLSGFARTEAGKRVAEATGVTPSKTWVVTSSNPRASHAAMNGETVGIDDAFSNGLQWPGESGAVDEVAGCKCTVKITVPGRR